MSRASVEGFVRRVFADTEFRRQTAADSKKMMDSFDLTPTERRALTGMVTRIASGGGELPAAPRLDEALTWN